jgi:hypothetical protein
LSSLAHRTMDKVQKPSNPVKCSYPLTLHTIQKIIILISCLLLYKKFFISAQ